MSPRLYILFLLVSTTLTCFAQQIDSFHIYGDIKITVDKPALLNPSRKTTVIYFALPNGNTTEQTMGKKMAPGDDWHYDIQHIRAQTAFIRHLLKRQNVVVVYWENSYKSWPSWKQKHTDFRVLIPKLVDSVFGLFPGKQTALYLNGHSGGGSFIFGYLAGVGKIPSHVKRISFIDSNYGYDSTYLPVIRDWLKENKKSVLTLFAYNDSVALYNGKRVVSDTGGTWYRGHKMQRDLSASFRLFREVKDSFEFFTSADVRIQFYFKFNLNQGIYHTQQVELNGFIHSVLCGTRFTNMGYRYYGRRAYDQYIQ